MEKLLLHGANMSAFVGALCPQWGPGQLQHLAFPHRVKGFRLGKEALFPKDTISNSWGQEFWTKLLLR